MQTASQDTIGPRVRRRSIASAAAVLVRRPQLALVLVWTTLFLVRGLLYLALIPPWQAPDEPTSFEVLLTIEQAGRLVSFADRDLAIQRQIVDSMDRTRYWELNGFSYGFPESTDRTFDYVYGKNASQLYRPALYQVLLLPVAQLVRDLPLEHQLLILRGVNLVFGALTVAIATLIAYQLRVFHPAIPLIMPALLAFHPQFTYASATFTAENLATTLAALILFALLRITQQGLSFRHLGALGFLLLLGMLTKRTILFIFPVVALLVLVEGWRSFRRGWRSAYIRLALGAAGIVGIGLLTAAAALRPAAVRVFVDRYVVSGDTSYVIQQVVLRPVPLESLVGVVLPFLNQSFWASYGWHQVTIPAFAAQLLLGLVIGSWLACAAVLGVGRRRFPAWALRFVAVCATAVVTTLLITIKYERLPALPQGRYLFPVIVPIFALMAVGIAAWWPHRRTRTGVVLVWASLVALDLYTLLGVFIPGFYP